ncbi:hypothetical protein [Microcystis sp. M169S2]|nr:hypothetical protein [Microcystis sp. M169S2]
MIHNSHTLHPTPYTPHPTPHTPPLALRIFDKTGCYFIPRKSVLC